MIEYWHWHTLHFGTETYWGGILPHSGQPGRAYRELARLGVEFERAGDLVAGLTPDADIAMVYSAPSKWLMRKYPPLADPDGGPDAHAYEGIFEPFYRGAFEAGRQVRILHSHQLHDPSGERPRVAPELAAERHPVLIAPGLYVADDGTLDRLGAYAQAGGHLVLGPRTGYGDHEARARHEVTPARLVRAAGVRYDEFSNLHTDLPLRTAPDGSLQLRATRWPPGGRRVWPSRTPTCWPSTTTRTSGAGPTPRRGPRHVRGHRPDGRRVHVVHNWSWQPATAQAPADLTDALDASAIPAGTPVRLGARDVRVLAAAPGPAAQDR